METFLLVFIGMTVGFLTESCQGDWIQWQQSVLKTAESTLGVAWNQCSWSERNVALSLGEIRRTVLLFRAPLELIQILLQNLKLCFLHNDEGASETKHFQMKLCNLNWRKWTTLNEKEAVQSDFYTCHTYITNISESNRSFLNFTLMNIPQHWGCETIWISQTAT